MQDLYTKGDIRFQITKVYVSKSRSAYRLLASLLWRLASLFFISSYTAFDLN